MENVQRTATGAMSARMFRAVMTFALSVWWSSAAAAQAADSLSVIPLEGVVVRASRTAVPVSQLPGHVSVVDLAAHQTAAQTTDDVLRSLSSFSLFRRSSSVVAHPTSQGANLRGISGSGASRTLVLLDGMPLNDPFGGWVQWAKVPVDGLQRVEVIRGGGAHLWGNYALGGVIQMTTAVREGLGLSARLGNGRTGIGNLRFGRSYGRTTIGAQVGHFDTDGYAVVRGDRAGSIDENANSRSTSARFRIQHELDRGEVSIQAGGFTESRGNGTPLTDNSTEAGWISARATRTTSSGSAAATGFVQIQRFESRFSSQAADRSTENPALDQYRVPSWATGLSIEWSSLRATSHLVSGGLDARWHSGETNERFRYVDGEFLRSRTAGAEQQLLGVFLQDIYAPTRRLTLTAGARLDGWRVRDGHRVERDLNPPAIRSDVPSSREMEWRLNPKIGVRYRVADALSAWAAGYRSFRAPTTNELYRPFRVRNDITEANVGLEPETLTGADMGLTALGKQGSAQLALFWNRVSDLVLNRTAGSGPGQVEPCGFVPAGGVCRQRYNVDQARFRGIEIEASHRVWRHAALAASYSLFDAVITEFLEDPGLEGRRVPQVPRHRLTVAGELTRWRAWSARLAWRFASSQFEDDANQRSLKRFHTIDATVSSSLGDAVRVALWVENLSDRRYPVGIASNGLVTVGAPRRISVGVDYELE